MAGIAAQLPRTRVPAAALRLLGDDRLVRLAADGDPRAFEAIYERHHQALYRYCRSIVGNSEDAADALQSTMAAAIRGLVGEQREIALKPWLFRVAHNECVSLLRKRRSHAAIDDALELEAPAHDPGLAQRLRELVEDMRALPDAQRGALVMHELSGLRYREIASALDTTEPHARQLVYEARVALHDLAEGRAMECEGVRRAISDADGRVLRGRRIRSHLRACDDCRSFDQLTHSRRRDLAALAPPLPAALAAAVLHNLIGGGSGGATAATSGGAGGAAAVSSKAVAGSLAAKAAAVVAATAVVGTGAVEVAHKHHHSRAVPSHPAASSPVSQSAHGASTSGAGASAAAAGGAVHHAHHSASQGARGHRAGEHTHRPHGHAHGGKPHGDNRGRHVGTTTPPAGTAPGHTKDPGHGGQGGTKPAKPTHPEHPTSKQPDSSGDKHGSNPSTPSPTTGSGGNDGSGSGHSGGDNSGQSGAGGGEGDSGQGSSGQGNAGGHGDQHS